MSKRALVVVAFVAVSCTNSTPIGGDAAPDPENTSFEMDTECDSRGRAPCPAQGFVCDLDAETGAITCRDLDAFPTDNEAWSCRDDGVMITCSGGTSTPEELWICTEYSDDEFLCARHSSTPDGVSWDRWTCAYEDDGRICRTDVDDEVDPRCTAEVCCDGVDNDCDGLTDLDDEDCLPTDEICCDGIDNDCDGYFEEGCECWDVECICVPGAWRFCDNRFGVWGEQYCEEDGMNWSPCQELGVPPEECRLVDDWYSPTAEVCCIENEHCCVDTWDLDHDGDRSESLPEGCPATDCHDW